MRETEGEGRSRGEGVLAPPLTLQPTISLKATSACNRTMQLRPPQNSKNGQCLSVPLHPLLPWPSAPGFATCVSAGGSRPWKQMELMVSSSGIDVAPTFLAQAMQHWKR